MFGSSLFGGFQSAFNDPFFEGMQETHRRHMTSMHGMFPDPFMSPMFHNQPQLAIDGGRGASSSREMRPHRSNQFADPMGMQPFGMMNSMFVDMNAMMGNMHRNMERMASNPNTHSYSSSSVMSYSNTGDGQPQYYHATSSTTQAPGGIRESRRTVRDSQKGLEKMAIGHQIGEKAHTVEKSRNTRTGDMEEKQDFVNIDETDAQAFDNEWKQRTGARAGHSVGGRQSRPTVSAITDGREYRRDREQRPTRHRDYVEGNHHSVSLDPSKRPSEDARPIYRHPTPARPKGPSKEGRQRDYDY